MTSPGGLGLAVAAGAAAGVGLEWWAAIPAALAAWAARVVVAMPRDRPAPRVDPFTVGEPWRRFVQAALKARSRAHHAVGSGREGPLRERLGDVVRRIDLAVDEVWTIARRGHELAQARRDLDPARVRRRVDTADPSAPTTAALRAQLESVERLERVIGDTEAQLGLLQARLDEAAARAVELAVRSDDGALGALGTDVDGIVTEMEALRQALEETGGTAAPGAS